MNVPLGLPNMRGTASTRGFQPGGVIENDVKIGTRHMTKGGKGCED